MKDTGQPYPALFSPLQIGSFKLKNRVVHASMSTRFVDRGRVTRALIDYHVNRGRGGASMTITEPLNMLSFQNSSHKANVFDGTNSDALKRWAEGVESEDCRLIGQVQDSGRGRHEQGRNLAAIGPSALPDDLSWSVPHVLTSDKVDQIISEYAYSSRLLQVAGFSGVEISAGHGHLFHQFFSRWSNKREDKYGGDLDGRTRLVRELILAIRAECGSKFIIGIKLPGEDGLTGSIDFDEAYAITQKVASTNELDYLTFAWGTHADTLDLHLPDLHGERAPYLPTIKKLREAAPGIPCGALGLVTDPNEAEKALNDGTADLVMLGRPLVTDPAWSIKAQEGREAQIRYCVSGNTCWHLITGGAKIQCDNNPRVGSPDEADWWPVPASQKRKVVIVGSGIAGLETAWVAGARGHDVTLFGSSAEVGGKTRLHAALPGGENLSSIYDYQKLSADRAGVKFELNHQASLDDVLALNPEVVVLATGSHMSWPSFLPEEYEDEGIFLDLRTLMGTLLGRSIKQPGTAVIYDHDHTAMTYAAAEFLNDQFDRVIILTPRERIASDESLVNRQGIYRRLYKKRIEIITSCEPQGSSNFEDGRLTYANVFTGDEFVIEDIALLTYATSRVPNTQLSASICEAGVDWHLVGDCYAPRFVVTATSEGHTLGNNI